MKHETSSDGRSDDAVTEVDAFLRRGGSVCFPALRAAVAGQISYHTLPGYPQDVQGPVYLALRQFLHDNGLAADSPDRKLACILVDTDTQRTPDALRDRAMAIREEVHVAIARLNSFFPPIDWLHRPSVRRQLAAGEFSGVHGPECLGKDIIRFVMGPQYDESHRRYAPHVIVPITSGADAGWFQEHAPEDVRQTYLAIQRRSGEMLGPMSYYEDVEPA